MRRYRFQVMLLCLIFVSSAWGQQVHKMSAVRKQVTAKSLSEAIDQIRTCVMRIEASFSGNRQSTGSGFLVNAAGLIVTARHVIYPREVPTPPEKIKVSLRIPATVEGGIAILASWASYTSAVVAEDPTHDLVILKPEINPLEKPWSYFKSPSKDLKLKVTSCPLSAEGLRDGMPVFTSGYPLNLPILITTAGSIASSDPLAFDQIGQTVNIRDTYWADMTVNEGNSGGPVFSLSDSTVLGVVDAYENAPVRLASTGENTPLVVSSGVALITPAHYVADLVKKAEVAPR